MKPQAPTGKPVSLSAQEIASALWDNIFGSGADARRLRNFNQTVASADEGDWTAEARLMRNPDGTPRSALPGFEPDVGGIGMAGKLKVATPSSTSGPLMPSYLRGLPSQGFRQMPLNKIRGYIDRLESLLRAEVPAGLTDLEKSRILMDKKAASELLARRIKEYRQRQKQGSQ